MLIDGIITKGVGGLYFVDTAQGEYKCSARGNFRNDNVKPIIGDRVQIKVEEDQQVRIELIYDRKNQLIRPPVANIDKLLIVIAATSPEPDFYLLDKIIVTAASKGINAVICVNKIDIKNADDIVDVYSKAGYKVIATCANDGTGIDEVKNELNGFVTALAGVSGVGKSSILNAVNADFSLQTSHISEKIERGRHTTRHVELFKIDKNSFVFDTPGFSSFEVLDIKASELQFYFPEVKEYGSNCQYGNCSHIKEVDCKVIQALKDGHLAKSRHDSYTAMYNTLKEVKEWEKK